MSISKIDIPEQSQTEALYSQQHSVDWRFCVDMPPRSRVLVISESYDGFAYPLQKVMDARVIVWHTQQSAETDEILKTQSCSDTTDCLQGRLSHPPFGKQSFDLIILPDGLTPKKRLRTFYSLLQPGGSLVIGFFNRWSIKKRPYPAMRGVKDETMRKMRRYLRASGFVELSIYGTLPNHKIPDIIFPLEAQTMRYTLNRHFGHKIPHYLLRWLSISFISAPLISLLLPAYYIIATKEA